jgi:hypothetical protein
MPEKGIMRLRFGTIIVTDVMALAYSTFQSDRRKNAQKKRCSRPFSLRKLVCLS